MAEQFDRQNPKYWKLGIFYTNADDSRFIVPKRDPALGWTFNFAHRKVIIGLVLIAAILIGVKLVAK